MLNIRLIDPKDIDRLAEVYIEVYRRFNVGEHWTIQTAREFLSYMLSRQPDLALLAEHDGKIVGARFEAIKPWWDGKHVVDGEIFVHPEFQRLGIGSKLLKAGLEAAVEKYGARIWDVCTFRNFPWPMSWYESLGLSENPDMALLTGEVAHALEAMGQ